MDPGPELRVAVDEVVREIPDEKKRRRHERGDLAVFVKLDRLARMANQPVMSRQAESAFKLALTAA